MTAWIYINFVVTYLREAVSNISMKINVSWGSEKSIPPGKDKDCNGRVQQGSVQSRKWVLTAMTLPSAVVVSKLAHNL